MTKLNNTATSRKAKASPNAVYSDEVINRLARQSQRSQKKGKYHFPKELLNQECCPGASEGSKLTLNIFCNKKFDSPIGALLDALHSNGNDVTGAWIEWESMYSLAKQYSELLTAMAAQPLEAKIDPIWFK
jgi:hypothetical protein